LAAPNQTGDVVWRDDQIEFWRRHSEDICATYMPHVIAAGYEPKKIATTRFAINAIKQSDRR
jgi:hypothetical protein